LATPFGVVPVPEAERLNQRLAAIFAARAAGAPGASLATDSLCYQSRDDLLEWPEPEVQAALRALLRGVYAVVAAVNDVSPAQFDTFTLQARAWFTIVQPDGAVPARIQPLTSWCGVYCVAAPERSPTRFDSGALRLYESRLGTMFSDASNATLRQPYTPGHSLWMPVPGQLAVFPASVMHEIALWKGGAPLVLVMLRVRFVAPGQKGWATW
jgi:hypothetical protein